MKAQRLRIRYAVDRPALSLSTRDIVRVLEDVVKAAGFSLAYSEGKRAMPQISIAAPLPQGVTSDWELAEIYLSDATDPARVLEALRERLPDGLRPLSIAETGVGGPSLQSMLRTAEYEVCLPPGVPGEAELQERIRRLLAADTWPAEYHRETRVRKYDLRPLVLDIKLDAATGSPRFLHMRLRCEPDATARADQVLLALGLPEGERIHRTRLWLDDTPAAVAAYRRAGEPEDLP